MANLYDPKTICKNNVYNIERTYDEENQTFTYTCTAVASIRVSEEYISCSDNENELDTLEREIADDLLNTLEDATTAEHTQHLLDRLAHKIDR